MKKNNKYFIKQYSFQEYNHGGIGYTDAETILASKGFLSITFPSYNSFSIIAKISRFVYFLQMVVKIKRNSIVVFLFPAFAKMNRWLLAVLAKKRVKLVCYLADINGIKDDDKQKLGEEIKFFSKVDYFILHNKKMKEWLNSVIPGKHSEVIEFFDFLAKPTEMKDVNPTFDIAFAGNLEKSSFVEQLHLLRSHYPALHFYLYGPNYTDAMINQQNVSWQGIAKPKDLPPKIKGAFGLVWDGDSIDGPGGSLGNYMRYISHHKLSLYILSNLPVIVPSIAGSAYLVEKYKFGITINNLYEIEDRVRNISNDEYLQMKRNMVPLAEKISAGGCLKEALDKIISAIEHYSEA